MKIKKYKKPLEKTISYSIIIAMSFERFPTLSPLTEAEITFKVDLETFLREYLSEEELNVLLEITLWQTSFRELAKELNTTPFRIREIHQKASRKVRAWMERVYPERVPKSP